jgi:putative endopeptidase
MAAVRGPEPSTTEELPVRRIPAVTLAFAFSFLAPAASACAAPQVAPWGLHLDYFDKSVKPGDDFFAHANGAWVKATEIPADRPSAGSGYEVTKQNEERLKAIIAGLRADAKPGSEERKLRDLHDAYMDEAQIEARGLDPAKGDLERIAAVKSLDDVARLMNEPRLGLDGPFNMWIGVDDKDPDAYAVTVFQSGLGLPERDYYLKEDESLAKTRDAYRAHLAQMLVFAGRDNAEARASAVYDLERAIAEAHWPAADRREAEKMYNPMSVSELRQLAPGFPWNVYLEAARIPLQSKKGERRVVVGEKSAFPKLASVFAATAPAVWSDYLTVRYLNAFAAYLPKRIDDAAFSMYGTTLQGRSKQLDRPTRAARLLDARMGEALGKIYVQKHFPASSKVEVQELVKNLIRAHRGNLTQMAWMSPETRAKALEKIDQFRVKVGYPDTWRDYSKLTIDRGNLIASIQSANEFGWERNRKRLDEKVDKSEWHMSPPTVNAYYNTSANEIVFPAGILQPPFFDPEADDAVNYGSIGAVIGHEISHGFDDQGSKFDGRGVLHMWWTEADRKNFETRATALVEQYNGYEPLPGLKLNGKLTLGENIADLAGLVIARQGYHLSLKGKQAPVMDGYTGDQRLYLAYAQVWRGKQTDASMRQRVLSNPHSPVEYRVNGVVRNDDGWYEAFDVKPGDKLYLAPEQRVRMWGEVAAKTAGGSSTSVGGSR